INQYARRVRWLERGGGNRSPDAARRDGDGRRRREPVPRRATEEPPAMSFTQKILIAMAAGIIAGWLLGELGGGTRFVDQVLVGGVLEVVGRVFIALLQMMVAPLVLFSLVTGVASLGDMRALGRLGAKALALYLGTTVLALILVLSVAVTVSPGEGYA